MIEIQHAEEGDFEEIIQLHLSAFKGLFAAELGVNLLKRFYKTILLSKDGFLFVAKDNSSIKGFICGVASDKNLFTLSFKLKFLYYFLKRIIFYPDSIVNLMRFIKKSFVTTDIKSEAELLSVVVSKDCRRKGIGKKLIDSFLEFLTQKRVKSLKVFTDTRISDATNFYETLGFKLVKTINLFGIETRCYIKNI